VTYLLPPLNSLRAFEAAARHLSFTFAARELQRRPPANQKIYCMCLARKLDP